MARSKTRALQLTDDEILAVAAVMTGLVNRGMLFEHVHSYEMCEQFADVFARISSMAEIVCKSEPIGKQAHKAMAMIQLADRYENALRDKARGLGLEHEWEEFSFSEE